MTKLKKRKINKSALQSAKEWFAKISFLEDQISNLEKLKKSIIIGVSVFLLKTQLIEFELKQLIFSLDQHVFFSSRSEILKRKVRTPKELEDEKMGLSALRKELGKYKGQFLKKLYQQLKELVKLRNSFTHHLFGLGSTEDMIKDSERGIKIANKVIKEIDSIDQHLKENDPLKELIKK